MEGAAVHQDRMVHLNHAHVPIHVQVEDLNKADGVIRVITRVVVYQVMIRKKVVP